MFWRQPFDRSAFRRRCIGTRTSRTGRAICCSARPIRWILYLYGGRVVPFTIRRTELSESSAVQEVVSAAVTYGHRFLTTSGRAGRAVKVRTFDDYTARLAEHFVILDRQERQDRIARGLEAKARSLGGRVGAAAMLHSTLLEEVPDLIEYPTVMAGTFSKEFLSLPEEVLTTTMIHHQHNFPVVDETGRLKPAFLVVTNTDAANEKVVARNYERVLTARLRDARFFWDADRQVPLDERIERLRTIRFHKKLGSYFEKSQRVEKLARWIATEPLQSPALGDAAAAAGRLAKADLATEMVAELTELQGVMGGIYAREEGQPERVWKAIYLPLSAGLGWRGCAADARSSLAMRPSRGRRYRWRTSSTRSSGCSTPERSRPDRAIRSDCGGRRTGFSRCWSISRR